MKKVELVIIGAGPAGMSAAVSAYDAGVRDILLLERDDHLGGILYQCIHTGFGLHKFGEELTGPEYSDRYERMIAERRIDYRLHTMVLDVSADKVVTAVNGTDGVFHLLARAVFLAMGCRVRSVGALRIAGTRPAGVYTAGAAQRFVNIKGLMPGREAVILGSGDIGLIMARRMTLEGARVKMVCELMPYSGGLARNIVQCLDDFEIPLRLRHTVVRLHGKKRLTGVTVAAVDENGRPIPDSFEFVSCDTLLLSVGLIPENELTAAAGIALDPATGAAAVNQHRETTLDGVFACGNVLQVHDLVDYVSQEAEIAGLGAAAYIRQEAEKGPSEITVRVGAGIRYVVPQRIDAVVPVSVYFRSAGVFSRCTVVVKDGKREVLRKKLRRAAPGEMERLELSGQQLKTIKSGGITLHIEEEAQHG